MLRAPMRALRELSALCIGGRRWYRVRGDSMTPALQDGDLVLVRTRPRALPPIGSLVVVEAPRPDSSTRRVVVKRVASHGEASFAVCSDNPAEARDSRHFGSLTAENLLGVATVLYARTGAIRFLDSSCGARRAESSALEHSS